MRYTDGDEIHTCYLDEQGNTKHVIHKATSQGCCWDELEYVSGDRPSQGVKYECLYRVNLTKKTIAFGRLAFGPTHKHVTRDIEVCVLDRTDEYVRFKNKDGTDVLSVRQFDALFKPLDKGYDIVGESLAKIKLDDPPR